jgi:hypothetical protein
MPQGQQMTQQQRQQRQNETRGPFAFPAQESFPRHCFAAAAVGACKAHSGVVDVSFPPSILNMNGTSMQVPSNIKSWGQLKQWANSKSCRRTLAILVFRLIRGS